jgi:hypothetical protein
MRTRLEAKAAVATLLGVVWVAAPLGGATREPSVADRTAAIQRAYRGPGLSAFLAGHHAWELSDWKTALSSMSEARAEDADQPEAQVRLPGVFMSPYIPKYYQSLAQCQLGQCDEVRHEMDDVLRLIKDAPSYLRDRYQQDCQKTCPRSAP